MGDEQRDQGGDAPAERWRAMGQAVQALSRRLDEVTEQLTELRRERLTESEVRAIVRQEVPTAVQERLDATLEVVMVPTLERAIREQFRLIRQEERAEADRRRGAALRELLTSWRGWAKVGGTLAALSAVTNPRDAVEVLGTLLTVVAG